MATRAENYLTRTTDPTTSEGAGEILFSEVISALSYALDITEGQPEGHAVRSCLIGMRVARELGLESDDQSDLFYALLLKDAGCSSNAAKTCMLFAADDLQVKRDWKTVDWSDRWESFLHVARNAAPDGSPVQRAVQVLSFARQSGVGAELIETRCERGAEIARMLGMSEGTAEAIRTLDEHWDGLGGPGGLKEEEIPRLGRIVCLAQTAEIFFSTYGRSGTLEMVRRRNGRWFDPELVVAFEAIWSDAAFWDMLEMDSEALQNQITAVEPPDRIIRADEGSLDRVAEGFARVIDAKSPYTFRHSERVAEIAVDIGRELGFTATELRDLRRAGLLHDIGKLGVSNLILDKPGKLTDEEMGQIRRHPDFTYRILARVGPLHELADLAASHHERMDGAGYHRGINAGELPISARVLAVADIFEALSADRPYRGALPPETVLEIMREGVGTATCAECFDALERSLESEDYTAKSS